MANQDFETTRLEIQLEPSSDYALSAMFNGMLSITISYFGPNGHKVDTQGPLRRISIGSGDDLKGKIARMSVRIQNFEQSQLTVKPELTIHSSKQGDKQLNVPEVIFDPLEVDFWWVFIKFI